MINRSNHPIKYLAAMMAASLFLGAIPATAVNAAETTPEVPTTGETPTSGTFRWAPEKYRKYGITYAEFCEKHGEPAAGHILIGTYLIDLVPKDPETAEGEDPKDPEPTITGEMYTAAMVSQKTYSQAVSFYKSELAGGEWRDIETASSLSYLLPGSGEPVDDAEMDEMLITVYISGGKEEPQEKDGDADKNPFLEPSPYNLDEMSSMSGLLKMTTDGTLNYTTADVDYTMVAENQYKRFMYDRLTYMFKHDEDTATLPLQDGDGERSKNINNVLVTTARSRSATRVEEHNDYVEENGKINYLIMSGVTDGMYITEGDTGTVASSARLLYHFSDTRDAVTKPLDAAVVNLWDVYLEYKHATGGDGDIKNEDKATFLYNLIASCDVERRAEAYYNLAVNDDFHDGTGSVLASIKQMADKGTSPIGRNIANMEYFEPEKTKNRLTGSEKYAGFVPIDTVTAAVNLAIKDSSDLYSDYSGYTAVRGTTAVSQLIFDDKLAIIQKTAKDDEMDKLITEAILATAIRDDDGKSDTLEAALLTTKLIPSQNDIFGGYLEKGLPSKYNDSSMTAAQQEALLISQQSTAFNSEAAMEELIKGYLSRETLKENYEPVLNQQLTWVRGEKSKISTSSYGPYAEEVRKKYEDYLVQTMKSLGLDVPGEEGDPLEEELKKKKQEALDNNDPKTAQVIDAILDKYKKEKPDAPNGYTPKIVIDPETKIPAVSYEPTGDTTDKNAGMLNGNGNGNGNGDGNGNGRTGDGDGNGNGNGDRDPNKDMLSNLEDALGAKFSELGPDGKIEMIVALNQYGRETGNAEAANLARTLLAEVMKEDNPFVYAKFKGVSNMEYVSLAAVDRARLYTRFRLVQDNSEMDVTMSRVDVGLSMKYRFGKPTVTNLDGQEIDMTARMASQTDAYIKREAGTRYPYIDEDDSQVQIDCRAEYIEDTAYSVVVTATMEPRIKQIVGILTDLYS